MLRYIIQCHSCEMPTDEQVFSDKKKSINAARNHSTKLNHCCEVMEEVTTQVTPIHYMGSQKCIASFVFGRKYTSTPKTAPSKRKL